MDAIAIARLVSATLFFVEFVIYGVGAIMVPKGDEWHPMRGLLYDNLIVTGLNMLHYVFMALTGVDTYVFLIYAFSCMYLAVSMLRLLTLRGYLSSIRMAPVRGMSLGDQRYIRERRDQLNILMILIFITLIAGFVIVLIPSPVADQVLFWLDFVPFVLAVILIVTEARRFNRENSAEETGGLSAAIVVYGSLVFWVGYPVFMYIGPDILALTSAGVRNVGYLSLDAVTKHLFMALSVIVAYGLIRPKKYSAM